MENLQKLDILTKGSKKGQNCVIICYITGFTFTKLNIFGWQILQYRNYLLNYVGYDNVYVLANGCVKKIKTDIYPENFVITDFTKENILIDYNINDIFSMGLFYTFFGGKCFAAYHSIVCRVYELYKHVGLGHYYHIQDDPESATINPIPFIEKRQATSPIKMKYLCDKDFDKYQIIKDDIEPMFNDVIITYCGTDYESYYNFLLNQKRKKPQLIVPQKLKGWLSFGVYDFMCVNSYLENKLVDYKFPKKYISEYHGYIKNDKKRVNITTKFYNQIKGNKLVICGLRLFSEELEYTDKITNMPYNDMLVYIAKNSYSTFVTHAECCWNNFISPRYIDAMLIDNICFVYEKYDEKHCITNNKELIDFMYVQTPEEFEAKVNMISSNEKLYRRIKYLQRKAIFDTYRNKMTQNSIDIFEHYFSNNIKLIQKIN